MLIEFRTLASRDAEVNRRYAELHARTIEQLAALLDGIYARATPIPRSPPGRVARFVLALTSGLALERWHLPTYCPPPRWSR